MKQIKLDRILEFGMTGSDIIEIQKRLKDLGVFKGTCKGNYKTLTEAAVKTFQNRYVGEGRIPLDSDGKVGPKTLWALNHPEPKNQRMHVPTRRVPGLPPLRNKCQEIWEQKHQAPTKEIPLGSNWGDGVPWFGGWSGAAWCSLAYTKIVMVAAKECGYENPLKGLKGRASTYSFWQWAKKNGMFFPIDTVDPLAFLPGNALLWQHKRGGRYTRTGHISEQAITHLKDGMFYEGETLGANEGHRVARKVRKKRYERSLIGLINPFIHIESENLCPDKVIEIMAAMDLKGSSKLTSTR